MVTREQQRVAAWLASEDGNAAHCIVYRPVDCRSIKRAIRDRRSS